MSFWASRIAAAVGPTNDGWEDDESLGDLSDQSLSNNNDDGAAGAGAVNESPAANTGPPPPTSPPQQPQQSNQLQQQPPPQPPPSFSPPTESGSETATAPTAAYPQPPPPPGATSLGPGLFMGRLTRFIETVTQPTPDDGNDDLDNDAGGGNGWNDDLNFDDDDDVDVNGAGAGAGVTRDDIHVGANNNDDNADNMVSQEAPQTQQPITKTQNNGWNDETNDLFDDEDPEMGGDADPIETIANNNNDQQQQQQQMNSGWDDDFDLEDIAADETPSNTTPSSLFTNPIIAPAAATAPAPPPPPPLPRSSAEFPAQLPTQSQQTQVSKKLVDVTPAIPFDRTISVDASYMATRGPGSIASSVSGDNQKGVTNDGWGDDDDDIGGDDAFLELDTPKADNNKKEISSGFDNSNRDQEDEQQLVDHTPPAPLPREYNRELSTDAVTSDDGLESANTTPLVDHTPPAPLPSSLDRATSTGAVTQEYPDLSDFPPSRHSDTSNGQLVDQTPPDRLSSPLDPNASTTALAPCGSSLEDAPNKNDDDDDNDNDNNSLDKSEMTETRETNSAKLVDQTPVQSLLRGVPLDSSVAVLASGSSVGESLESIDETASETASRDSKLKYSVGRMVDYLPTPSRFHRGISLDASLAVMGASSVGESLESINEEDEEPDSPVRAATRNGIDDDDGDGAGGDSKDGDSGTKDTTISFQVPLNVSLNEAIDVRSTYALGKTQGDLKLVDHTPLPHPSLVTKQKSISESIDVAGALSVQDGLDNSDDGVDDVKEDMFGPVVDHTPETPKSFKLSVARSLANETSELKLEEAMEDTVYGVAETNDVDADIKQDDAMDESSHEGSTHSPSVLGPQDDVENRSLTEMTRISIAEERHLVDHVPQRPGPRPTDASVLVVADASVTSSHVDDNVVNDDATVGGGFGPIVDHTPSISMRPSSLHRSTRSVATSVVTQITGAFGDVKLDEDESTVEAGASNDDFNDGWDHDEPDISVAGMAATEEKHLVDHVPERGYPRHKPDASIVAIVENPDDSSHNDDATIGGTVTGTGFGPMVDVIPSSSRSVAHSIAASVMTQASNLQGDMKQDDDMDNTVVGGSTVGGSVWAIDEEDASTLGGDTHRNPISTTEENHLVDHVPQGRPLSRPTDASTLVFVDPLDAVSEVDDNEDTFDENPGPGRFGQVVDQTPALSSAFSVATSLVTHVSGLETAVKQDDDMDGTWFGVSTAGGDGWDEDDQDLEDLNTTDGQSLTNGPSEQKPVVDHVPIPVARPSDESTAVVVDPSVISAQIQEEKVDGAIDAGGSYGIVVDHLPSERSRSRYSVANSMATLITGLEDDMKQDEELDDEDGWDEKEPELEGLADSVNDELPHLVDHVPERPESRPTDASTLVVADPSDTMSQVDDFGQEEQNFGPVVDQTPLPRLVPHTGGGGSTIVNAPPSEVDDDLDDAVETAEDPGDNNGWDHDDIDIINEAPNPQSGNDEESKREQLVDYLPPPHDDDDMPDLVRDGSSEMATVGEKSVLPTDPKEDEFGPVVDHTPQPPPAALPVIERKVRRPDENSKKNAGSTAVMLSAASEENSDCLDDDNVDEFGPVVDQLPTISSRSSFPPSRGGSTVDALGTVSEVDDDEVDDLIDGDGWEEEDIDIDAPEPTSAVAARPVESTTGEDKNLSVKWVDSLSAKDFANYKLDDTTMHSSSSAHGDHNQLGSPSGVPLSATIYYDPESRETNAWDDSLNFDDGHEDDTPPSTPRTRLSLDSKNLDDAERGIIAKAKSLDVATVKLPSLRSTTDSGQCKACAGSSSSDCPCVQRILEANEGKDAMCGTLATPEGDLIKVNFEKLLQSEIMKRRLLEKEAQSLRASIELLKASKSSLVAAGESQMDVLNQLHNANQELSNSLKKVNKDCGDLRNSNIGLQAAVKEEKDKSVEYQSLQEQWKAEEAVLRKEIETTKKTSDETLAQASQSFSATELDLRSQIAQLQQEKSSLSNRVNSLESDCNNLRSKNESVTDKLASSQSKINEIERERSAWLAKESSFVAEIEHLKDTLDKTAVASNDDKQLREQMSLMQSDLAAKTGECAELSSQVSQLQQRVQAADVEKFKYTKDLARVSKQQDEVVTSLKKDLNESRSQVDSLRREKDQQCAELQKKLSDELVAAQQLRDEKEAVQKELNSVRAKFSDATRQQGRLERQIGSLRSTETKSQQLEQERNKLKSDLDELSQRLKNAEKSSLELLSVQRERDVLHEALIESKQTIIDLQGQVDGRDREAEESMRDLEFASMKQEREGMQASIAAYEQKVKDMTMRITSASDENRTLKKQLAASNTKSSQLEAAIETAKLNSIKDEAKMDQLRDELEMVRSEMKKTSNLSSAGVQERDNLANKCAELETQLSVARAEVTAKIDEIQSIKAQLLKDREHFRYLQVENQAIVSERDNLQARCRDIEMQSNNRIVDLEAKCEQLTNQQLSQTESHNSEILGLKKKIVDQEALINQKEQDIASMEAQLQSGEERTFGRDEQIITELQKDQQKKDSDLNSLREANDRLLSKLSELETTISSIQNERNELVSSVERYKEEMSNLQDDLAQVRKQRDIVVQERNLLEEDNEEMLVQFGILKEQMDANDELLQQLAAEAKDREQSAAERTEERLESPLTGVNGENSSSSEDLEREIKSLSAEKSQLEHLVNELASSCQTKEGTIDSLESDKERLATLVDDLQMKVDALTASNEDKEADMARLESDLGVADEEYDLMKQELEQLRFDYEDVQDSLQQARETINQLENEVSEQRRALEQKDGALQDMQYRLQHSGHAPQSSAELDSLKKAVRGLEQTLEESRQRVMELESINTDDVHRLSAMSDKLTSAEDSAAKLEKELRNSKKLSNEYAALKSRLDDAQDQLNTKEDEIENLEHEIEVMQKHISELQNKLKAERHRSTQPSQQVTSQLHAMQDEINALKFQLDDTSGPNSSTVKELQDIQRLAAAKDEKIKQLESEHMSLTDDISRLQHMIATKEAEMNNLVSEMENLKLRLLDPAASRVLEDTNEEAESVDHMRSHIILLARSLEQSESKRAEAIERLEKERQGNADSLRRLSENVKRFYSTLSCGEA